MSFGLIIIIGMFFFAGKPDWFILLANTMDIILVGRPPDFVRQFLGCEPDEIAQKIRKMSESPNLDPFTRKYYSYLLEQLNITYPQSEPGTIVNLELPNWKDEL